MHIGSGPDRVGKATRILVGQCAHNLVGILLGHPIGHGVHEAQQRTHGRPFPLVNDLTLGALAIEEVVVLAKADVIVVG